MKATGILRYLLVIAMIFGGLQFASAQDDDGDKKKKKKDKTETSSESGEDKKIKRQNQEQFLGNQKGTEDYSYEDRTKISKPMMPYYDSDTAAFYKSEKKKKQQEAYTNREYYYPAKPKNQWEVGVHLGSFLVNGDVRMVLAPWKSWGIGVSGRKSFGYLFSLRVQYLFGSAQGKDWVPNWNLSNNAALNGALDPNINYHINTDLYAANNTLPLTTEGMYFHNHKTTVHDIGVQGMLTFGNLNFHKERTIVNFNAIFGIGAMFYNVKTDALDENGNIYDFSTVYDAWLGPDRLGDGSKGDVIDALDNLRDGDFETEAESHSDAIGESSFNVSYTIGGSVGFHLSKRITLSLESRLSFTVDDLLDGNRWQVQERNGSRESRGLTRDFDNFHFTSVGVHFHLGKNAIEPLHWMNPMDFAYKKMGDMDPEKAIDDLLKDDDKDGVPNRLDHEAETPEGAPVDPKGVALDSDKDGIMDMLDLEPFSPPGYPIDENGIAQLPEDDSPENLIQESLNCDQTELPSIHYDLDKYYIKPEYYAHLHQIAEKMQLCPDIKVVAVGHTDIRHGNNYNMQLSWNRVEEAINFLVEKYSLDRGRFVVTFEGEQQAEQATTDYGHYLNRRVEFRVAGPGDSGESAPAQPFPKINAGSNKR